MNKYAAIVKIEMNYIELKWIEPFYITYLFDL